MEIDPIVEKFLTDICTAFPEIRSRMDRHDDYMTTSKMQEFAEATTEAFASGDTKAAVAYLTFMSKRLNVDNDREYEFIDVYYVENLFWPPGTEAARIGWPLVPENLKRLYLEFHRKPPV
jgi:hypothetical protein